MTIKNDKIIIRKITTRENQFCNWCGMEIPEYTKVILASDNKGNNRKYYHIECIEEEIKTIEFYHKNP
jgi:hypothetical protein